MRYMLPVVLAMLVFMYRSLGAPELEGSAWSVKVRAKTLFAFSRKDTLVFDRGNFSSARSLAAGALPSGYAASAGDGAPRFEASLVREDGSVLDYAGKVKGDRMKGVLTVTSRDGRVKKYSFKGRRFIRP